MNNQYGLLEGQTLDEDSGVVLPESHDVRHYAYFAKIHDSTGKQLIGTAMVDGGEITQFTASLEHRNSLPEVKLKVVLSPDPIEPPMRRPFTFKVNTNLNDGPVEEV